MRGKKLEEVDEDGRGEWKCWLKAQHSKNEDHIVSSPITSCQIDGETMETVTDFIFLGSKITADGDCSHEIKRHLLLGRKAMTKLESILRSRDITLRTKVHLAKAMVFPVVMYGCESWTIKKTEPWRTDAFELWCWRRLLIVPWTARRSWGFSRQEYWSGLPCPPPGDLPNPGIEHRSLALQADSLPSEPPGKPSRD